ncbi:MAG TPA: hypothetical protein VEI97_05165 [bacterium]|nr:hypothetical protein [bacterium]
MPGRRPSPAVLLAGRLGRGALWIVAAFFLLQAIFTFLQLRQINVRSLQAMAELRENHELLAEWQQRAAFAQSPAFLEEAVKEFTLTRDTNEIVIVVEPSPVPPVGDIR